MHTLRDTIARILRRRRCSLGWTRERVAERAVVHPHTVMLYETGQSMKIETAECIAAAMRIDLECEIALVNSARKGE